MKGRRANGIQSSCKKGIFRILYSNLVKRTQHALEKRGWRGKRLQFGSNCHFGGVTVKEFNQERNGGWTGKHIAIAKNCNFSFGKDWISEQFGNQAVEGVGFAWNGARNKEKETVLSLEGVNDFWGGIGAGIGTNENGC